MLVLATVSGVNCFMLDPVRNPIAGMNGLSCLFWLFERDIKMTFLQERCPQRYHIGSCFNTNSDLQICFSLLLIGIRKSPKAFGILHFY